MRDPCPSGTKAGNQERYPGAPQGILDTHVGETELNAWRIQQ